MDNDVQIDLNFGNKRCDLSRLEIAKKFINQLADFDFKNRKYIEQDYQDEDTDTLKTYIEYHLEELGEDELSEIIDFNNKKVSKEKQLLKKLHLVRMGLYPEGEDQFAIFDYSIGSDITDQLVVLFTGESGQLDYITMES